MILIILSLTLFVFLVHLTPPVTKRKSYFFSSFFLLFNISFLPKSHPLAGLLLLPHHYCLKSVKHLFSKNHCARSWGDKLKKRSFQRVYKLLNEIGISIIHNSTFDDSGLEHDLCATTAWSISQLLLCYWASYLSFLYLSFHIWDKGIIIVSIPQGYKDEVN